MKTFTLLALAGTAAAFAPAPQQVRKTRLFHCFYNLSSSLEKQQ
jgi:hypothetical protein